MKITEDVVKEREMIISSLEAELTSYKNEVRPFVVCICCCPSSSSSSCPSSSASSSSCRSSLRDAFENLRRLIALCFSSIALDDDLS